jgi:hypothetical protein
VKNGFSNTLLESAVVTVKTTACPEVMVVSAKEPTVTALPVVQVIVPLVRFDPAMLMVATAFEPVGKAVQDACTKVRLSVHERFDTNLMRTVETGGLPTYSPATS